MFHFEWPWLSLLIPIPLMVILFTKKKPPENELPLLYFPAQSRLKKAFETKPFHRPTSFSLYFTLLFLSWVCLIVALMQPEEIEHFTQVKNRGHDLMLVVDISGSMQALDFSTSTKKVSRLDVTKEVVGNFVKEREGDRIGLITFGEKAYIHTPLTPDTQAVAKSLQDVTPGMAGNATSIGDAIALAIKTLKDRPEKSRVIVLLTDGEDNASVIPPLEAAKLAKDFGIRIYAIGMGKGGIVPFPTPSGHTVMAEIPLDETLLKEIADQTEGAYFKATDEKMLQSVYQKINHIEKSEAEHTLFLIRDPLFALPLSLSMILLFILLLISLLKPALRKNHV